MISGDQTKGSPMVLEFCAAVRSIVSERWLRHLRQGIGRFWSETPIAMGPSSHPGHDLSAISEDAKG
jgi:hypothetical protein